MNEVNFEVLTKPFPKEAIKQRKGANNRTLCYVETHSVIRRLIEATGNDFNFSVIGIETQDSLVQATVELELGGCKRQHVGTQRINGGNDDDCVKAAISDAIKKCATLFGIGLELYGPDYEAAKAPEVSAVKPVQTGRPVQSPAQNTRPVQAQPQSNKPVQFPQQQNGGNGNGQNRPVFRPIDR
jgi:hypothetical protein